MLTLAQTLGYQCMCSKNMNTASYHLADTNCNKPCTGEFTAALSGFVQCSSPEKVKTRVTVERTDSITLSIIPLWLPQAPSNPARPTSHTWVATPLVPSRVLLVPPTKSTSTLVARSAKATNTFRSPIRGTATAVMSLATPRHWRAGLPDSTVGCTRLACLSNAKRCLRSSQVHQREYKPNLWRQCGRDFL